MKIAQVAPLAESVPPRLYGGTERIVSYLTEELVRQGHDVTLFASGDSETSAELHPIVDTAMRFNPTVRDTQIYSLLQFEAVRDRDREAGGDRMARARLERQRLGGDDVEPGGMGGGVGGQGQAVTVRQPLQLDVDHVRSRSWQG